MFFTEGPDGPAVYLTIWFNPRSDQITESLSRGGMCIRTSDSEVVWDCSSEQNRYALSQIVAPTGNHVT